MTIRSPTFVVVALNGSLRVPTWNVGKQPQTEPATELEEKKEEIAAKLLPAPCRAWGVISSFSLLYLRIADFRLARMHPKSDARRQRKEGHRKRGGPRDRRSRPDATPDRYSEPTTLRRVSSMVGRVFFA